MQDDITGVTLKVESGRFRYDACQVMVISKPVHIIKVERMKNPSHNKQIQNLKRSKVLRFMMTNNAGYGKCTFFGCLT